MFGLVSARRSTFTKWPCSGFPDGYFAVHFASTVILSTAKDTTRLSCVGPNALTSPNCLTTFPRSEVFAAGIGATDGSAGALLRRDGDVQLRLIRGRCAAACEQSGGRDSCHSDGADHNRAVASRGDRVTDRAPP